MKIVVTGGAGFIGSALCLYFIQQTDFEIVNVDKLTYAANLRSLDAITDHHRYQFIQADITDTKAMNEMLVQVKPDAIIHLAAESHVDRSIESADNFIHTNIVGTFNLLETARQYWSHLPDHKKENFRFLNVSTDEVYGSLGADGLFEETTPYDPSSPYSASKAASDHLAIAWHRTYGFPALISNCSNNYGPRQFPEKLVPLMIINAFHDKPLPVYGNGTNIRDWLYVDDHARALHLILEKGQPGEKYNVGGRNERTNLEVVHQICAQLDKAITGKSARADLITYVKDRPGHDQRYAIDASRLENDLGWRAQENFETGLEKTVEWYLQNRDWWQPLIQSNYVGKRHGLIKQGTKT